MNRLCLLIVVPLFILFATPCHGMDIIRTYGESKTDQRNSFPVALLAMALEKTKDDMGPYQLSTDFKATSRDRSLLELQKGKLVNVLAVPTRPEWEETTLSIPISIHKDLLDYRVLLIDGKNAERFAKIKTYEQLKQLRFGLMAQWTTTQILQAQQFNVITSSFYEGLFGMLMEGRFDVFLRGLSEVTQELAIQGAVYPDLMIQPTLAVHLPMPVYFFVSPHNPKLRNRIEAGLKRMQADGSFDELFDQYHGEDTKDMLKHRRIIEIPNPYLQ